MAAGAHTFSQYQAQLQAPLSAFEAFFQAQIHEFEPQLQPVIAAVLAHPGKRLRPLFVFAAGQVLSSPTPQALRMAAIVEFIHLATLVHDDILDGAAVRHGAPAHHQLFGHQVSVLTGDTLFLHANQLAAVEEDVWVGRAVAAAAKATCSGEIAQSLSAHSATPLSFQAYHQQILGKTGKLFGLSCALGAWLAGLPAAQRDLLARYGELFGIAYQLYDDMVDIWGHSSDYKKTLHTDHAQHKWTLPWILLHQSHPSTDFQPLWASRSAALQAFHAHGIFPRCQEVLQSTLEEASACLQGLPQAPLLSMPLSFVGGACAKLQPAPHAVNQ